MLGKISYNIIKALQAVEKRREEVGMVGASKRGSEA